VREDLENVHDEAIEDVIVLGAEGFQAVEDDELDVVVRLLDDEVDEAGCGG
jgi:hypothetical protein